MSFVASTDARRAEEPWLIWDNREKLKAQGQAGLHALVCGVSDYSNLPHPAEAATDRGLGMHRLSSTALTAYLIADWLIRTEQVGHLSLPLATCRLLLSPSPLEQQKAPPLGLQGQATRPTMGELAVPRSSTANMQAAAEKWRADAATSRDATTLFYFAGHGIQRTRGDQVLLLDGFGAGPRLLEHAVDTTSLRNGMAPTQQRPNMARGQFYFIDACRNLPAVVLTYQQLQASWLFDVVEPGIDDRRAPIFFAAPPDAKAQSLANEQTLFGIALLNCLNGAAAMPPRDDGAGRDATHWHVTSQSLNRGLKTALADLNRRFNLNQSWIVDGFGEDAVLCYLTEPPKVPVEFMVEPAMAVAETQVRVTSVLDTENAHTFPTNGNPHPYRQELLAGEYVLEAIASPPFQGQKRSCPIEPLGSRVWKLRVQP